MSRAIKTTSNSTDTSGHARNKSSFKLHSKLGTSSSAKNLSLGGAPISFSVALPGSNGDPPLNTLANFADYYVKLPDSKSSVGRNPRGQLSLFSPEKKRKNHNRRSQVCKCSERKSNRYSGFNSKFRICKLSNVL